MEEGNLGTIAQRLDPPQHQPYKLKRSTEHWLVLGLSRREKEAYQKGRANAKCKIDDETQQQSHYFPTSSTTTQPKKERTFT